MNQSCAKHKLCGIDVADGVLDVVVPIRLDWDAVEDGHEGSDGKPNDCASLKDVDTKSDIRDTEQTPIEAEDS